MQILLSLEIYEQFVRELRSAGFREIGGLLFGEHLGGDIFRLAEISVQRNGGTKGEFVRRPEEHQNQLNKFFESTREDHTRFNYFGEWHSHPNFPATPSPQDMETMQSIVGDPTVGINFAVLLVLRGELNGQLSMSATVFAVSASPRLARIYVEAGAETLSGRRRYRVL